MNSANTLTRNPATSDIMCAASVKTARLWASNPPTISTIMKRKHNAVPNNSLRFAELRPTAGAAAAASDVGRRGSIARKWEENAQTHR